MAVLRHIVDQHAEEAAFLWLLRDRAATAPDETLDSLVRLDERVEAHLDGLRVAGDGGWELCREQLARSPGAGEVFAAVTSALAGGGADRLEEAMAGTAADPAAARAAASALGWAAFDREVVDRLLASEEPGHRRLGVAAVALHRQEVGGAVERALEDGDPGARRRAIDAADELGRVDLRASVVAALGDDDEACRLAAAFATVGLSAVGVTGQGASRAGWVREALAILVEAAEGGEPVPSRRACEVAARCLPPAEAADWLRQLAEEPATARRALAGMAAAGDPAQVPWLIERMDDPAVARGAGEAVSWIAGLDLAAEGMIAPPPQGFDPGSVDERGEDPGDETVDLDSDEGLPWPDAAAVAGWWLREGRRFPPGVRHLGGRPIEAGSLGDILRHGSQRLRRAAAVELARLTPGRELFATRAPAWRQRDALDGALGETG